MGDEIEEFEESNEEALLASDVKYRKRKLLVDQIARAELTAEGWTPPDNGRDLREDLKRDIPPVRYVVEGLMTEDSNVIINATFKAGKTTLAINLAAALADRKPLFGKFAVRRTKGRKVAWWNFELGENTALNWLRDMNIKSPQYIHQLSLKGRPMPFLSDHVRDWTVRWLKANRIDTWIIDPLSAVYTGEENSNTEAEAWLKAVDEIKRRAHVGNIILVTHTGHSNSSGAGQRTRGASRWPGWADATWTYSGDPDHPNDTARYLSAFGRDVSVDQFTLAYDEATRTLTYESSGGPVNAGIEPLAAAAAKAVREYWEKHQQPVGSKNALKKLMPGGNSSNALDAIDLAVANEWLTMTPIGTGKRPRQEFTPGPREPMSLGWNPVVVQQGSSGSSEGSSR
jgi:hypothetical protein